MVREGHPPRALFGALMVLSTFFLLGMASAPPLIGGPAPEFTLKDLKGREVRLSDFRGQVVLVNFWATWCEPCKKEMPEMEAAYAKLKDRGFEILAINFGEKFNQASGFAHDETLSFPVLLDPRVKVASRYRVVNLPVSFFVDPQGLIQHRVFGGTLTEKSIGEIVEKLEADKIMEDPFREGEK